MGRAATSGTYGLLWRGIWVCVFAFTGCRDREKEKALAEAAEAKASVRGLWTTSSTTRGKRAIGKSA